MASRAISSEISVASSQYHKEENYWLNRLSGELIKSHFPYDYKKCKNKNGDGQSGAVKETFKFYGKLLKKLMGLCSGSEKTLHVVAAAGLGVLLYKYTGNNDVIIGTPIYKQDKEGEFINTVLALRNWVTEEMTFKDMLIQTRQVFIEANDNQNYSIERLLYQLNISFSKGDDFPLFDIVVMLEGIHDKNYIRHINTNMTFSFNMTDEQIEGIVEYNPQRYKKETVRRVINAFTQLMREAVLDVNAAIVRLGILWEEEKQKILFEFNDTQVEYPHDKTIHELFAQQVEKTPDRIGVVSGCHLPHAVSYGELNRRSSQLASLLREKGVKSDTIVGIMVDRSLEMMIGILGILKAGGAYLPMDPGTPIPRIVSMLEDSHALLLLTTTDKIQGQSLTSLKGIHMIKAYPLKTGERPQISDLDCLPIPDRSLVDYEKYGRYIGFGKVKNCISLQGTRGCPYKCAYCHRIWPKRHVSRSAEALLQEVRVYYNMGIRRFAIIDDIFNLDMKNSARFFELIMENGLNVHFFFPAGLRGDILTKKYIDLMIQAGVINFALALETASPRLQKLIGKNLNIEKLGENIRYICRNHPQVILELFTMHGFPSETETEAMATLNFIKSQKWLHFPYINILRIYMNTDMEKLAVDHGISRKAIFESDTLSQHDFSNTLPFDKSFTKKFQSEFLNEYFLSRERLLHVLPYQMKVFTRDELAQRYDSYVPVNIKRFEDFLEFAGIREDELKITDGLDEDKISVSNLNEKIRNHFNPHKCSTDALRFLLLDLSQFFTKDSAHMLYDIHEPPLGLMNLMTYLYRQFGEKIVGKIAKTRIDFDSYEELEALIREFAPDFIGIRTLTFYKDFFHETVEMIRLWGIDAPIIAGGPYATSDYTTILQDRNIDLVVMGEGELTIAELMGRIIENSKQLPAEEVLKEIAGLAFVPGKEGLAKKFSRELIFLDALCQRNAEGPDKNVEHINRSTDSAYVIYTSGSTGKPKGGLIKHHSVVNRLYWMQKSYPIGENDVILQKTPFIFDVSVWELFWWTIQGSSLYLLSPGGERNPETIIQAIEKNRVTTMHFVPSMLNAFLGYVENSINSMNPCQRRLSSLRQVFASGEALGMHQLEKFNQLLNRKGKKEIKLVNLYGPTEATVDVSYFNCPLDNEDEEMDFIPIGKPIDNIELYILNKDFQLQPLEVSGELCIAGVGLARGYLNRPELTAEKFIDLAMKTREDKQILSFIIHHSSFRSLYRTGDLARWLPNGNIEFLGRMDHQVKIRGFRVELEEIENCLLEHHEINEAVVTIGEDNEGSRFLCAHIVSNRELAVPELKGYLSRHLPSYSIPSFFMYPEEIPLTPNGKVDRKVLHKLGFTTAGDSCVLPRDEQEKKLSRIWQDVLMLEEVGINDNLFNIGGDSIKTIKLLTLINSEFQANLKLADIYAYDTIEKLSARISQVKTAGAEGEKDEIEELEAARKEIEDLKNRIIKENKLSGNIEDIYPMSDIENGIVYHSLKGAQSAVYHDQIVYQLKFPGFAAGLFKRALVLLVDKHSILRTCFNIDDFEEQVQIVYKSIEADILHFDISGSEKQEQEGYIKELLKKDRETPLDITKPLWRLRTFALGADNIAVIWIVNHAIIDGWSNASLMTELNNVYWELKDNPAYIPGKLKCTYKDFVIEQAAVKKKAEIIDYWKKELEDYKRVDLPAGVNISDFQAFHEPRSYIYNLGLSFLEKLEQAAKKYNTTVKRLCFAAYAYMVTMFSYDNDIVVGLVTNNRPLCEDGDKVIGCFINTVPLRLNIPGYITYSNYIHMVNKKMLELKMYDRMPLLEIVNIIGEKTVDRNPIFDILFNYVDFYVYDQAILHNIPGSSDEAPDRILIRPYEHANTLFNLTVNTTLDCFWLHFSYTGAFEEDFVKRPCGYLVNVLNKFIDYPGEYAAKDEIPTEQERCGLLYEFNNTTVDYPGDKTLQELFEEQVDRTPGGEAVVFADPELHQRRSLTYRQLNEKANQVAHMLRRKGIGPGMIVGVLLERSLEMVTALLGVLKAGGAYLPIEPDTPTNRMISMLEDSRVPVILTQSRTIKGKPFSVLQGLDFSGEHKGTRDGVHVTGTCAQIRDFGSLPIPDRSLIEYEKYNRYIGLAMVKNSISLQTTRGCPYHCLYCHKIWPKKHVVRSAEHVFQEIRLYYNMGIRRFVIIDDIFNLDIKNSTRLFGLIIKNGLKVQFFFPNGMRGDILTPGYIDLMVEAGTVSLALALETASPRLQKLIRKNMNLEKLRESIEYFCKEHPQVILELFTMHGFPTETEEEAMMSLEFIKCTRWFHFPYVHILKIYPNSDMAKLALESGISRGAIARSAALAYHELPETLPFAKSFSLKFQADYLNEYFLSKERLLHVLPYQMKVLTEDEIIQKYDSYLPTSIKTLPDLWECLGIVPGELGSASFLEEDAVSVPDINARMREAFSPPESEEKALRLLFLDLSQFFSHQGDMLYDVVEPPLGLMYLLTYLNRELGGKIHGKIAKSRIDFDSYEELKDLLETFKPDLIGIRTLTFYKDFFHRTVGLIRHWGIDIPVIAGGPYATSDYEVILQDRSIDLVVLSEGEIITRSLVEKMIENNGRLPGEDVLRKIPGLAFVPGKNRPRGQQGRDIVLLDELEESLEAESRENLTCMNIPSDLCYVIFTSGSTGKPKGTVIEHRNVVCLLRNDKFRFDFHAGDVWTMFHSYSFDFSVWEMYGALLYGGRLVVIPKPVSRDPEKYLDLLRNEGITVLNQTPSSFYHLLNRELERSDGNLKLRYVIFGGEALSPGKLKSWNVRCPGTRLINMYGITETTVHVTYKEIGRDEIESNISNIGTPLPGLRVYVMDHNFKLMPPGAAGELFVGGVGPGRGYLNRPGLTREKFIENPYDDGDRLYRSGDLGRWTESGELEYLGRIDHQVKIRGFRVEPAEIEGYLVNHRSIEEVVIVPGETLSDTGAVGADKYLCAYIVAEQELEVSELRGYLAREFPDYMIPSYFMFLDRIPLTPNGKVDRGALPGPGIKVEQGYIPPGNEVEEKLAEIWGEVLGVDKEVIGIDSDFFLLGGHSLKVSRLVGKIHKVFNVKVSISEIFITPTIRELSGYILEAGEDHFDSIEVAEEKEYYKLSSAQGRLYIQQWMSPGSVSYNIPQIVVIEGDLKTERLEEAFRKMIKRYESLRTSFEIVKEGPVQKIHDAVVFEIEYHGVGSNTQNDIIRNFVRPFDLSRPPLLRVGLIETGNREHIFMLDMHHIVSDGTSMEIFTNEFITLYEGNDLPELRLQYRDFSQWHNGLFVSGEMKRQEEYWLREFEGDIPVLNLPIDAERPSEQYFEGKNLNFKITPEETAALKDLVFEEGVTLFMVILAVYHIFLSKLSGQEDIIVGTVTAGRRHADLEQIIGMFVNTLALRTYPLGSKSFKAFLEEVREKTLKAFENQDYPFEDLVEQVLAARDASRNPLFDVMFMFQNLEMQTGSTPNTTKAGEPDLKIKPYEYEHKTAKFDLTLHCKEVGEELAFSIEYNSELFKQETIERMVEDFSRILNVVIKDRHIAIRDIELESEILIHQEAFFEPEFNI